MASNPKKQKRGRDNVPVKLEDFDLLTMSSIRKNDKNPTYPMLVQGTDSSGWAQYLVQVRPPKDGGRLSEWSLSDGVFMGQRRIRFTIPVTSAALEKLKTLAGQVPGMIEKFNPMLAADANTGLVTDESRRDWIKASYQPFAKDPSPSNVKKGADGKFARPYHMNLKDGETEVKYHPPSFSVGVEVDTEENDRKVWKFDIPNRAILTSLFLERKVVFKNGKPTLAQVDVPVSDMWNPAKKPDPNTGAQWDLSGFRVVSMYFRLSPYLTGKFGFSAKLHSVLLERVAAGCSEQVQFLGNEEEDAAWLAANLAAAASSMSALPPLTDEEMMSAMDLADGLKRKREDADDADDAEGGVAKRRRDAESIDAGSKRKRRDSTGSDVDEDGTEVFDE